MTAERAPTIAWKSFFASSEERAQVVAGDGSAGPGSQRQVELLGFWVDDEAYALAIEHIQEIIKVPRLTPVPRIRPEVLGISSLRGTIVPVVDTRQVLGMPRAPLGPRSRILVLRDPERPVGLVVDRVTQVLRLEGDSLEAKPKNLQDGAHAFVARVGRVSGNLVLVLDVAALLSSLEVLR